MTAVTGKDNEETWEYLKKLGAKDILDRSTMSDAAKPLGRTNYAGAVDTVGGNVLANVISELKYGGTAAMCGMAGQVLPVSSIRLISVPKDSPTRVLNAENAWVFQIQGAYLTCRTSSQQVFTALQPYVY